MSKYKLVGIIEYIIGGFLLVEGAVLLINILFVKPTMTSLYQDFGIRPPNSSFNFSYLTVIFLLAAINFFLGKQNYSKQKNGYMIGGIIIAFIALIAFFLLVPFLLYSQILPIYNLTS